MVESESEEPQSGGFRNTRGERATVTRQWWLRRPNQCVWYKMCVIKIRTFRSSYGMLRSMLNRSWSIKTYSRLPPLSLRSKAAPYLSQRESPCMAALSTDAMSSSGPGSSGGGCSSRAAEEGADDAPPAHLSRLKASFCRQCGSPMRLIKQAADHQSAAGRAVGSAGSTEAGRAVGSAGSTEASSSSASSWRHVCSSQPCGYVDYFNPKVVVGCIVEHQGKILLCRCDGNLQITGPG